MKKYFYSISLLLTNRKLPLFVFCMFLSFQNLFAQKEADQWHFGQRVGLNFQNGSPPQIITNSKINASYSSSCIADSLGNLLFYVRDGDLIYNKNNDTMDNGINIGGHTGGIQTSIVIRKSGSQYYVVNHNLANASLPSPIPPMMNYAIVNMNLAAGLGSVTALNMPISPVGIPMVSKLAATKHCNKTDHWLLFHEGGFPGSNKYYSYLVSSSGISSSPVISSIGYNQTQAFAPYLGFYHGLHKFSPNGKKVCATFSCRRVELYDFDNSTGILSNVLKLDSSSVSTCTPDLYDQNAMGIEFSQDGTKLYISYFYNHPSISQFDLCAGSAAAIYASKTTIAFDTVIIHGRYKSLQLSTDGKIYVCATASNVIGVIHNPNAAGIACNYQAMAIPLGTISVPPYYAIANPSLPNFESHFFEQKPQVPSITGSISCGAVNFSSPAFCAITGYSLSNLLWNFGDQLSGSANTSSVANPLHVFTANGTYTVKLSLNYFPCGTDTILKVITVSGLPTLSIMGKNSICKGESSSFTFNGATIYSLNTISSPSSTVLQPTITSTYTLSAQDPSTGCKSYKQFKVTVLPCTTISESHSNMQVKVFPNPSKGIFNIQTENFIQVEVKDLLGKKALTTSFEKGESVMNLSDLSPGVYLMYIYSGAQNSTIKLIRE